METINTSIDHIAKWLEYLEENQHEKLEQTISNIEEDFAVIQSNRKDRQIPLLNELVTGFAEAKEEVEATVKKEKQEIFKKIREALNNAETESAEEAYKSLSTPVRKLIMEHHKTLDKIHSLLPMVTGLGYKGLTHDEHLKAYINLFDFYNTYNKLIYIEENMLFPALVSVFENKPE